MKLLKQTYLRKVTRLKFHSLLEENMRHTDHKGFEIGVYTLADIGLDPHTGQVISTKQRLEDICKTVKLS